MLKNFKRLICATSPSIIFKCIFLMKNIFFFFFRDRTFFRALVPERLVYLLCEFLYFSVLIPMRKQNCLFTKAWPLVYNVRFSLFVNNKQLFFRFRFFSWSKISFLFVFVGINCFVFFLDNNICSASSRFITP
jgi:hypothetical protein